jgi:hypothetical protein
MKEIKKAKRKEIIKTKEGGEDKRGGKAKLRSFGSVVEESPSDHTQAPVRLAEWDGYCDVPGLDPRGGQANSHISGAL